MTQFPKTSQLPLYISQNFQKSQDSPIVLMSPQGLIMQKLMSPRPDPLSPSSKNNEFPKLNFLGWLDNRADSSLSWRQAPKHCIVIKTKRNIPCYTRAAKTATEITQTGYSTKTSSDWSVCTCHEFFFGTFHVSGMQDKELPKSLRSLAENVWGFPEDL